MKNPYNDLILFKQEVVKETDGGFALKGGLHPLKVMYTNGNTYIIQVEKDVYYYGDGEKINTFGQSAVQFLRFNPHMKDVSNQRIVIPDSIAEEIKKHFGEKNARFV
jgi:hypothetical protein